LKKTRKGDQQKFKEEEGNGEGCDAFPLLTSFFFKVFKAPGPAVWGNGSVGFCG